MSVHLSDIAKKVGVSKMTVSRALREDPTVADETRKRVLAAAKELGYSPNPKLARLMSEMASYKSHPNPRGELAYITTSSSEYSWRKYYHQLGCFNGAQAGAKAYGYSLLPVWALSRRFTSKGRLSDFLWSRGVDGVIVSPLGRGMIGNMLDIDWARFCSVQIGATMTEPKLNLVRHNHYEGMLQALRQMENLGYQRIGLCFSNDSDIRSYHRWASAYLYWRTIRGFTTSKLPTFHYTAGAINTRAFRDWIKRYRITGLIGMGTEPMHVCEELGIKIPDEIGYSVLDHPGGESTVAGIDQDAEQIGSMAVDILVMSIRKGAKGVPRRPVQSIIEGNWVPGKTVRSPEATGISDPSPDLQSVQESF